MGAGSSATTRRRTPDPRLPVRARQLLRVRAIWIAPLVVASLVIAVMTALYIGSVVNPLAHLRGLPVGIVDEDQGLRPARSTSRSDSRCKPACWRVRRCRAGCASSRRPCPRRRKPWDAAACTRRW